MIQPDRPPYCSANNIGTFWVSLLAPLFLNPRAYSADPPIQKYWLPGGLIYITERILREIRARHTTYISKVIQHPSKVFEVQIKKEHISRRAGQYIFINCPEVSYWQYRG
jgi:NADPH oxidase